MQERGSVAPVTVFARTRRRVPLVLPVLAGLVIVVDQLTKTWALRHFSEQPKHLFWTLRLAVTFNSGAAFSIGAGVTPLFVAVAVVMVVVLALLGRGEKSLASAAWLGLVLGGALGNLVDRLVRHHGGAVIDWIDFRWWPVFNVADACIVVGAILLALTGWTRRA